MSVLYFVPVSQGEAVTGVQEKVSSLYDAVGFSTLIAKDDLVAIKTHFGEAGNRHFIDPQYQVPLVTKTLKLGGKPFWTDTNTLYVGNRANAVDHMLLAHRHGFTVEATGAPVVIADGIVGRDEVMVAIEGRHSKTVGIAPGVAGANALLVMAHPTGHLACGYGGIIKTLGMGLSSRKGKLYQHSVVKPRVKSSLCRGDGTCVKWCPRKAISMVDHRAVIDQNLCIGCGECIAVCRPGAVTFQWRIESKLLQERMAEQAFGVYQNKRGKIGFISYILNVTRDCDCLPSQDGDVVVSSVGVVASLDPVAIEHATIRLIEENLKSSLKDRAYDIDFLPQLAYAEELGMGSSQYDLIPIQH